MEKKQLAVMMAVLLVGLFIGYAVHVPAPSTQLKEKVSELETTISSLQTEIDHLKAQIAEQERTLYEKDETIEGLTGQVEELNAKLKQVSEKLTEKDKTIESLTDQIEELNAELSEVSETRILGIYFSPRGECEDQIIYWIGRANSTIHVLIYSFTLDSISEALITAHNRGVEAMAVFEKSQITQYSEYQKLRAAGIPVRNDTNTKLMHHKVMIIDGMIVLTGSFNWSKSAQEYNNENLIIIQSTYIAAFYEEEFQEMWAESV